GCTDGIRPRRVRQLVARRVKSDREPRLVPSVALDLVERDHASGGRDHVEVERHPVQPNLAHFEGDLARECPVRDQSVHADASFTRRRSTSAAAILADTGWLETSLTPRKTAVRAPAANRRWPASVSSQLDSGTSSAHSAIGFGPDRVANRSVGLSSHGSSRRGSLTSTRTRQAPEASTVPSTCYTVGKPVLRGAEGGSRLSSSRSAAGPSSLFCSPGRSRRRISSSMAVRKFLIAVAAPRA